MRNNINWNLDEQRNFFDAIRGTISLALPCASYSALIDSKRALRRFATNTLYIYSFSAQYCDIPYTVSSARMILQGCRNDQRLLYTSAQICIRAKLRLWSHVVITFLKRKKHIRARGDLRGIWNADFVLSPRILETLQPQYRGATICNLLCDRN